MTVARLRYWRISNHLQFGGVTSLTMAMAARRKSSRILDGGETAMTRLRRNLLNNGGKTAMLARQKSPLILRRNLLDDDYGGTLAISSNS